MSSLCTLLTPCSQVSRRIRCQNCGNQMNQVSWKQCLICKTFNLCDECALPDIELESAAIVLLIAAYNTTISSITMFNTSYAKHWHYRIADVLKATMAAPTYFPPHKMHTGIIENGHFVPNKHHKIYIDGGVFANDPELIAIWAIRMQWKKMINYHLLSIGTGHYVDDLSATNEGGYLGWIFNKGLLVNTLMEATRSFTEIITNDLTKSNNIKRMKFNFRIKKSMELDDPNFIYEFDKEWKFLKNGEDFQTLMNFYDKYIDMGPN
ncbi:unnamed protein product [Didymodactylos carnosus]|uniref:PNPLA domain-containing protein n=1 Tax=Didymodactylos carnosus TaxID=1234261 RepID=A0A814BG09_9BILA|nr:unnamed protein product [Didymodactylos carnosus]CAF1224447.1 unnamed protein product [Didymodactylos carnosus]CAF3705497.1 unnamed protein product [Didymodactylos carnosus]CAF4032606.1 unnamed protein product [Didymodactylos carnosus]